MKYQGLSQNAVAESRQKYGANTLTQIPPDPLWKKMLNGLKDPMILILEVALVVQVILLFMGQTKWYEPAGILIAILIANCVASISEHNQENKATALKADEEAKETAKVIRDGVLSEIHVSEVVVGDVIFLQAGDKISADGVILDGEVKVDQATLNGETEEATKKPCPEGVEYNIKDLLNEHYVYRGTVVCAGEAYMEVRVVGDRTLFGELALEVQEDTRETPLQHKLRKLAKQISTFGYVGAIAIIVGILVKTLLTPGACPKDVFGWIRLIIDSVTVAVTIVVCAVPEGLPMLTSLLMSLQSLKMAKDNVLVRKLNGLETAGSLSLLFSDKTGTITEGRLSVVELVTGNVRPFAKLIDLPPVLLQDVIIGVGVNNSATVSKGKIIGGNSTDRAMMTFLMDGHAEGRLNAIKVKAFDAFNSTKKTSSVDVDCSGTAMTYVKGAPERILDKCSTYIDETGKVRNILERDFLISYINTQAGRSMRLLSVAKHETGKEDGWTLVCLLCIRDNVRKEAVAAIHEVQNAGIQVVMVTGDRKETAAAIAREAGLVTSKEHVALTSAEMAEMSDDELRAIIPNLRVVARALPTDKSRLVRLAQDLNLVVGMTGDGVNDSPALKKADVGFAMGSGTEVAKEAGDITILDDNFTSIAKAILYGRTMFKSIRKFLIFQLTVNVAAVLTCFLGPLLSEETVIMTVVQLLLVNLAMDTLAAIAFGSEPTLKEYMRDKPVPRSASIISKEMFVQILIPAFYITFICLAILLWTPVRGLFGNVDVTYLKTALFATFMMAITFNGFSARTASLNIFKDMSKNYRFPGVMGTILVLQFAFVTFGGEMLSVERLSPASWLTCILLALVVIPIDMIRKIVTSKLR